MVDETQEKIEEPKKTCKNCLKKLHGPFCSNCGQHQRNHHLNFNVLAKDFLGDTFSFDSRLMKTLRIMVKEPGQITRQFLAGHRVAFIPPIRLYISLSLLA